MRISDLIQDIVFAADEKFGYDNDSNDGITVEIIAANDGDGHEWQVNLLRPSTRQLSYGVVNDVSTIKTYEYDLGFYTLGHTLVDALKELLQKIDNADPSDWQRD